MKKYIKKYVNWISGNSYDCKNVKAYEVACAIIALPFVLPIYILSLPFRLIAKWLNK